MGLLNSVFGGGTSLDISLDSDTVRAGDTLTGTITVKGGKKAATITALQVKVLGSRVGGAGDFEHRLLFDGPIARDVALPAGSPVEIPLSVDIPSDADPTHDYQLTASADIPGVADPSGKVAFSVEGDASSEEDEVEGINAEGIRDIMTRWPALLKGDEEAFDAALREIDDNLSPLDDYAIIAVVKRRFNDSNSSLRHSAIALCARLLGERADESDLEPFLELTSSDDVEVLDQVVGVTHMFGPIGELVLERLIDSPHARVRKDVGQKLAIVGGPRQRELAERLRADPDAEVAASGLRALGGKLLADPAIVEALTRAAVESPDEEVRVQALHALSDALYEDDPGVALPAFSANVQNASWRVRATIAGDIPRWPQSPEVMGLIETLAADEEFMVRTRLVGGVHGRCPDHLRPLWEQLAASDPHEDVRSHARLILEN
ncbi:HEAT repeat domain-containing protein [Myxococcus stipitatus]|uniref:HEAT repeat domain-containing protein n=1 Tax=Myxococcus stipitatus TaxID=83455 RepID=UPI001F471C47|nr:HEAT repeat domain-containing protein [Myxococcus stipitatus]MCE9667712.1 HEAT repeat domain-containing protein [Myxococcus stipitatus]